MPKPTTKNLNNRLLKFIQGSEILEKEFGNPVWDGAQVCNWIVCIEFDSLV